jgi:ABC-2 type transport system permease protein
MPNWLQWVASLNPLSYAIEPIRYVYLHPNWSLNSIVIHAPFGDVTLGAALLVLVGFCLVSLLSIQPRLQKAFA